jgi:hypothetical protein
MLLHKADLSMDHNFARYVHQDVSKLKLGGSSSRKGKQVTILPRPSPSDYDLRG